MNISKTYNKCDSCGNDCDMLDIDKDQQCWGQVIATDEVPVDDDWWWIHSCEGHDSHRYIPEKEDKK